MRTRRGSIWPIEAQNEENLAWAEAYAPIAAKLWAELEW